MTMSDVDQGPSDDELFNEAVSDETLDNPVVTEQVEQPVRDEAGRFAKKDEPEVVAEVQAEKPAVDDNAPMVPSWRVREINDEKRTLADKLAALEAEKVSWQRQPQQQPKVVEAPKVAVPDPLIDPEGYREHVLEEARQERLKERRDESMEKAHEANPEEFAAAYKAATENGVIPELKLRMNNSRDPGKELLAWHREQKVKAEVGHDPNAWLEKKLEERLNDPAFLQKAIERSKGASQQSDGRPRVDLPPSLNGASRSNASLKSSNDEVSDEDLFKELAG
jgi:hypothetical protein